MRPKTNEELAAYLERQVAPYQGDSEGLWAVQEAARRLRESATMFTEPAPAPAKPAPKRGAKR